MLMPPATKHLGREALEAKGRKRSVHVLVSICELKALSASHSEIDLTYIPLKRRSVRSSDHSHSDRDEQDQDQAETRRSKRKLIIGCTSSEHSFVAELIANNSDLLIEILIRVPAKSLIRFKLRCAMGFRILQMHRDNCEWIVKYRVQLRPILFVLPKTERKTIVTCYQFNVLSVVKGANEKDFTLVLAIWEKVISYNVKSKTLKELHDLSTDDLDDWGASWTIEDTIT
ncbi:hypothetical protein HYC85_010354 [Camellia sinensis]|uniref:Uncharacterized protein n=1 Tax=Camellia sinensis TaxID=4442 RepID=A0A7J7HHN5_CAMSI|nr:hypothetical protein HYC85_010354 [Camellia sinensis]